MAGNIQNVSFVNPLDPAASAALQVQQQQLQRNQAIADALRQRSLTAPQVANGSRESWTQGLAMLGDALASKHIQSKNNTQAVTLAQQQGQMLGKMFGFSPQATNTQAAALGTTLAGDTGAGSVTPIALPASSSPQQDVPPQQTAPTDQVSNVPQGGGQPESSAPPVQQAAAPVQALQGQQPMPAQGGYPMSLSGNPMQDYTDYATDPDAYNKARIAAHAPTDLGRMMQQAGIDPTSDLGHQIMQANIAKQNNIPPVAVRPGGVMIDPVTHQPVFQAAQVPVGSIANYGQGGKPESVSTLPGASDAIRTQHAAEATGAAAGKTTTMWDAASGTYKTVPLTDALRPGGITSAPGPGGEAGAKQDAVLSSDAYRADAQAASTIPQSRVILTNMQKLASSVLTGPGAGLAANVKGGINYFAQSMGLPAPFDGAGVAKLQELGKFAEQLSQQTAGSMGGVSGITDAKLASAVRSLPNEEKSPQALHDMLDIMHQRVDAAATFDKIRAYGEANGINNNALHSKWVANYDPDLLSRVQAFQSDPHALTRGLNQQQAAALLTKYRNLRSIGAFGQ